MDEPLRNTGYAIPHSIPTLLGEDNLQDWIIMVELALYPLDLSKYIECSVPEPNKAIKPKDWAVWRRQRGTIACLLQSTLHKVRHHLTSAGMPLAERDPYIIFKTVKDVLSPLGKTDGVDKIANRLSMCQVADYSDLQAFRDDLQYMRLRLKQVDSCPPDSFLVAIFLNKVRTVLPESHALVRQDHVAGALSWNQLMAEFDGVISSQTVSDPITEMDEDEEAGPDYSQSERFASSFKGVVPASMLPPCILQRIFWCWGCEQAVSNECGHSCHGSGIIMMKDSEHDTVPLQPPTTMGSTEEDNATIRRLPMMTSALIPSGDDHQSSTLIKPDTKKSRVIIAETPISKAESTKSDSSNNSSFKMAGTVQFDAVRSDGSVVKMAFKNAIFSPSRPRILSRSITTSNETVSIKDSVRSRPDSETGRKRESSLRGSQKRTYSRKTRLFSGTSDDSKQKSLWISSAKA
ncbi:hypothetical protein BD289DRAFT_425207 [Coniella lustricola]|uniref:Uncharacterized protein n=1 Tax=Coniella lustricola TaxID=2025994 RepID=A0A2T3AHN9_9PEZI|nr:hypothetical protein BD289DRAFT_425207 [Coniella lustricola]